jgi:hypothetical protein
VSSNQAALSVFQMGVRDSIDLGIKIEASPYFAKAIFLDYIRELFIPTVESNRQLPGCQGKPSIIFCDNCGCHCSDGVLRDLAT